MSLVEGLRKHLQSTQGGEVDLIETHISWVLLTDALAYKLKKPVNLGFVDFSTLAARHQACDDELRLNRRLACRGHFGACTVHLAHLRCAARGATRACAAARSTP